jgi:coenzyme F420 hydrogenase subunit beta
VDFKELNYKFFGAQPKDALLGNCLHCYAGYSTDDAVRVNSSSGGVVTQLLVYALESGLIDGALVVRMNKEKPLEPDVFIARTREEIISCSKSKYCPVTIVAGLKEILRENGRYVVVGLPCHIHGIRKAQLLDKRLSERIVLVIGLFCARATSFEGTRYFLRGIGVPEANVAGIAYRGRGWPGGMTLTFKNGSERFIPFAEYRSILGSMLFMPQRCFLCSDALGELADVSVGDAWLPRFKGDRNGKSIAVSRSAKGEDLLRCASQAGKIRITPITERETLHSQRKLLRFKKRGLSMRLSTWSFLGRPVPQYVFTDSNASLSSRSRFEVPVAFLYYIVAQLASRNSRLSHTLRFGLKVFVKLSLKIRYLLVGSSSPYWSDRPKSAG